MNAVIAVIIAYILVGAYQIVRDFREPFHNRPAYARGHKTVFVGITILIGWLPIKIIAAPRYRLWRETLWMIALFVSLSLFGIWLS